MQGADQIVMAFLSLVVDRRPALDHADEPCRVEALALAGGAPELLGEGERSAPVAIGHARERGAGVVVEGGGGGAP